MSTRPHLALGESPSAVDPAEISRNVYRGAMWELARIGKLVPAAAQGVLLLLLLVFAIAGMAWPSIIFSAVLIGIAIWSQRSVHRWAEEHNARVAPAARAATPPPAKPTGTSTAKRPPTPAPGAPRRARPVRNRRRR